MSTRFQTWLLANTKPMQFMVNERLAKRGGAIGQIFTWLSMGERQYGRHTFGRWLKTCNYWWVMVYHAFGSIRPVASRFTGVSTAPLNYTGMFVWLIATNAIFGRFRFNNPRDILTFNVQDQPEFWYERYAMLFPTSFLHNRLSAHYIEINHIFSVEMTRKIIKAKKVIKDERERCTQEERHTRYITNPNYVYMGFPEEAPSIQAYK